MITLNTERGLVKIESWQEIEELPGFARNIDPKKHKLKEIIGRYIFKDFIACGLSSCHRPHGKGYIVSTKSGPITNIGKDCGRTHFGVEFEELSSKLEREIQLQTYRDTLGSFLICRDQYKAKLDDIRAGIDGADNLNKKAKALLKKTSACPEEAVEIISRCARGRNPDLFRSREASREEIEELEVIQGKRLPRPYHIDEKVGRLQGISFLYPENDLRHRLVIDLGQGLIEIDSLSIDDLSHSEFKYWSGWVSEIDRKFSEAEDIIKTGRTLFRRDNLYQVTEAMTDGAAIKKYKEFIAKNCIH